MIPYEDLCRALDIYNRKLRGEDVPEEAYQEQALDDEFDIVESEDAEVEVADIELEEQYDDDVPDVTAETEVPQADFGGYDQPGSGEHAEAGYNAEAELDSGAAPGQPAEGQEQAPEQLPDAYPDDQDPNRQQ